MLEIAKHLHLGLQHHAKLIHNLLLYITDQACHISSGCTAPVHSDGKLGYIQPVGAAPKAAGFDATDVYGVGAFLLAGSELYKLSCAY